MKAIYKGKLYTIGDNLNVAELIDDVEATGTGETIRVPWNEIIADPTNDEINNICPDWDEHQERA